MSNGDLENVVPFDIQEELRQSYLTYAMSVIISRALPDARDGLKPSQRRILVAMHDLNLGPASGRLKCAKICGDTSGNYHPHGESVIYPTLARMAQDWVMREVLIDKQGNFGSLAGAAPAAMRYTEARLSHVAAELLDDLDRDTVDFLPTYDQRLKEPAVLPSRIPNLIVNGSTGIAVGMATSIPPHNLSEACRAIIKLINNPNASIDELLEVMEGPDFPTGGIICGRSGIRQGYMTGRSKIIVRARTHFETEGSSDVIVVTEIPYLDTRDNIREKLELLVRDERVPGIARVIDFTDRNTPPWQVCLHIVLKRDADKDVVLNQLWKYSPLQNTISVIMLALVGNRPKLLALRDLLLEFIRHRVTVTRRRIEYLLAQARKRRHTVEGLLIALINIDQVIETIRRSPSRAAAKLNLQGLEVPRELIQRALGETGFQEFVKDRGEAVEYGLSTVQAEAIVAMQLGALAGLERDELGEEFAKLLEEILSYLHLLSDEKHLYGLVRGEMETLAEKYSSPRRTTVSDEELGEYDKEALITEETMVVTLTLNGYIKRSALDTYQAQNRGGKGITGAKTDDDDPIKHLFVASTHAYLLFFSDLGRVYWQKVYDLPLLSRTSKGRAIVNLLTLQEGEKIVNCVSVRVFENGTEGEPTTSPQYLAMVTRKGLVKKTLLSAYSRPQRGGIIAIKLDEDDALVDVAVVGQEDQLLLSTADGMAIRFHQAQARTTGRDTRGVKGISLRKGDQIVAMVVVQPDNDLLTVCVNGFGKRTPFGRYDAPADEVEVPVDDVSLTEPVVAEPVVVEPEETEADETEVSGNSFRPQRRGGKGIKSIRTTERNGKVVDAISVSEEDEILMVTAGGMIQRVRVKDIKQIGRNTQGVTIIRLKDGDQLVSIARVPPEELEETEPNPDTPTTPEVSP